jgi:hypothetical protein
MAAAGGWSARYSPHLRTLTNYLYSVAVSSASNAWAVGEADNRTLVLHWNGRGWKRQVSPSPAPPSAMYNTLAAVSATSPSNAWAVGTYDKSSTDVRTLVLHWNGRRWTRQESPAPKRTNELSGVVALSRSDAWAVGWTANQFNRARTLVLHWNGRRWTRQPTPSPGVDSALSAVTATSSSNAWAVGTYGPPTHERTLVLHWNGRKWTEQQSPQGTNTGRYSSNALGGTDALSPSSAWAVGASAVAPPPGNSQGLVLRWDGRRWQRQSIPSDSSRKANTSLAGVAATSADNAWAVGEFFTWRFRSANPFGNTPSRTVILHWNGMSWQRQPSPNLGRADNVLSGVAASSPTNAWAVGYRNGRTSQPLILHCC